ncbi:MAG: glycosyltransferase family 4 protein [archaeon]|nr:glycosyltransferase family 4 protein [archaeon]
MKILFVMDRMHLNELNGYSINAKRIMESLLEKGIEVHAICHGKNEKIKVHELSHHYLYKKVFTFPIASILLVKKLNKVFAEEKFDAVIAKPLISTTEGFWNKLPGIPLNDSIFYSALRKKCAEQNAKLFYLIDGITEKNSFAGMLVGSTKQNHLNQLKKSNGIITLSNVQKNLLQQMNVKNNFFVLPASVDIKTFRQKPAKFEGINTNDLNLLYLSSSCDEKDLQPLLKIMKNSNKKIKLFISGEKNNQIAQLINDFNLGERIAFLGKISDEKIPELINAVDIGVYLKKFNSPIGDASTMVKVSEYLACGKPALFPEMSGVIEQTGDAGIVLDKGSAIVLNSFAFNKKLLEDFSVNARKQAEAKLDLNKNTECLKEFIEGVVYGKQV